LALARHDRLISNHYGSLDTIAAGGDQRFQQDDPASALFFYQKAIDTHHKDCWTSRRFWTWVLRLADQE